MIEPYQDVNGNTYEKSAIQKWLKNKMKDLNNVTLKSKELVENKLVKKSLVSFKEGKVKKILDKIPEIIEIENLSKEVCSLIA